MNPHFNLLRNEIVLNSNDNKIQDAQQFRSLYVEVGVQWEESHPLGPQLYMQRSHPFFMHWSEQI